MSINLLKEAGEKMIDVHDDLAKINKNLERLAKLILIGPDHLHWAIDKRDKGLLKEIITGGGDINAKDKNGCTPLFLAVLHGQTEIVQVLLQAGADVTARTQHGYTLLELAEDYGHIEIAELLKQHSMRQNKDEQS